MRHGNADALSRNPMGQATNDDEFSEEVQDVGTILMTQLRRQKVCSLFNMVRT
jgi:hypothetical protein